MAGSAHKLPHTWILLGLILGAALGCVVNAVFLDAHKDNVEWVVRNVTKPLGDVFMNLLFLAIIPLVFASLVVGVTRLGGMGNVGRVGVKTVGYFLVTTFFAAVIGLTLVNVIRPGDSLPAEEKERLMARYGKEAGEKMEKRAPFGVETFVNIVPKNPLDAFLNRPQ